MTLHARARQEVESWGWHDATNPVWAESIAARVAAFAEAEVANGKMEWEHNERQRLLEWLRRHNIAPVEGEDMLDTAVRGLRALHPAAPTGPCSEAEPCAYRRAGEVCTFCQALGGAAKGEAG